MSVGGAQFPAGQLILSLKQLWPHIHTRSEISGSIEKLVSPKGWSVVIVARREDDNRVKGSLADRERDRQRLRDTRTGR